jgi:hypothetical protein
LTGQQIFGLEYAPTLSQDGTKTRTAPILELNGKQAYDFEVRHDLKGRQFLPQLPVIQLAIGGFVVFVKRKLDELT